MNHYQIFRIVSTCLLLSVIQFLGILFVNAQTPIVGVPCYVNGPSSGSTQDAFVGVYYNPGQGSSSLSSGASAVSHLATFGQIGATWGDAYDSRNNSFYAAAALKRHSDYGPDGSGAIYKISADNTATSASLLINLNGLSAQLPDGSFTTINTGAASDHGSLGSLSSPGTDNAAFALAGKSGLGDIDVSPTRNTLWVVNAKQGQVIEVNISNPASPSVGKVYPVTSATTGLTAVNGVLRPWGLEIANDGSVYVGVVATAENVTPAAPTTAGPINLASTTSRESIANRAKLKGYVLKLNPITGLFTQVLAIDLNYARGNPGVGTNNTVEWVPWFDDYTKGFPNIGDGYFQLYPQPLVADIEIMDDGSMLVSLMDRFGLQTGSEGNSKPGTNVTFNERGRASGDIVRVLKTGTTWSSTLSNRYGDAMSALENAAALGGIAYKSGTNEFIAVSVDAISASTNGIVVMSQAGAVLDNQDLVTYAANPLLGSKGLALGDVEIGTQGAVAVCTTPTIQMQQVAPTCTGGTTNNNGALVVSSITNADKYGVSIGATYTGPTYASATSIFTLPDTLKKNIPNAGATYTIRFFNGADNCIKDTTITVAPVICVAAPVKLASLGNYVWFDYNNNGVQDSQEPGVNKAKVYLYKNNVIVDSTTTSSTGYYLFDSLHTGQYQVYVKKSSLPYGYNFTKSFMGADTTKDSNSDTLGYSNKIYLLTKTDLSDSLDLTLDFGIHLDKWDPYGYIYCEETGAILKGGHVTVTGPSGAIINILADGSSGFYRWETNLDGNYTMTYTHPSGKTLSTTVLPISTSGLTATQIHALDGSSSDKDGVLNGFIRLGSLPNIDTTALVNSLTSYNPYFLSGYVTVGIPWPTENNFPVTCISCPTTTYPLCQGESYTLSAPTSGMTGVQWYKDGVAIPAPQGTADTLVVNAVGVYRVTGYPSGSICKDSSCCPITIVAGTNCPCTLTSTVTQSSCNDNGTPIDASDDYFTVTVNASIANGNAGLYEVVLGANPDGTGGTVLNTGGTAFGTPVTVGSSANLKADGQVRTLTVRSSGGTSTCYENKVLTAVQSCTTPLTCKPILCMPIGFKRN
jgi:hypothetical protein